MARQLPPYPTGDIYAWARQIVEYLSDQTREGTEAFPTPVALQHQVDELEQSIATQDGALQQQEADVQQQKQTLLQQEQEVRDKRLAAAEMWGKVNIYQELLQSIQEILNGLRDKCNEMEELASQSQSVVQEQSQSVAELQNAVNELTADAAPQLAAS